MKQIYILLTCSPSILSRSIKLATKDEFTHSSIAFDPQLSTMCSFGRKVYYLPFPGGLVHEPLASGYYKIHDDIPCALFSVDVTDEAFDRAVALTQQMFTHAETYHYNLMGLVQCRRGIPFEREGYYFCSQFVARILADSGALTLPKPPSLMRPLDYQKMPQLKCLYRGRLSMLKNMIFSGEALVG